MSNPSPKARPPLKGPAKRFDELPETTRAICRALVDRLAAALPGTVHGIYIYGAAVFPETDYVSDLDVHVLLNQPLTDAERSAVHAVHRSLTDRFPSLTPDALDLWYVLRDDVGEPAPRHQLDPDLVDTSWALHRAHLRAGYCIVLHGPAPLEILPAPTWPELAASLQEELRFVLEHAAEYPAYCVLNACRLMLSHRSRDVVFSKKASADWAMHRFPEWADLIAAALRGRMENPRQEDRQRLAAETGPFLEFIAAHAGPGRAASPEES